MLSYNPQNVSKFLSARSRANLAALKGLADLELRRITDGTQARKHADRVCQRAGLKLNEVTCGQLAQLFLSVPTGRHERLPASDRAAVAERVAKFRAKGRNIGVTLLDQGAIAALDALTETHGSQRAAIEHALNFSAEDQGH